MAGIRVSYCSFGEDSDVSVFRDKDVKMAIWCDWCKLVGPTGFIALSEKEMIDHLLEHRSAGHKVPESVIQRLKEEITNEGNKSSCLHRKTECNAGVPKNPNDAISQ